jgi:hypothetical protein
MVNQSPTGISRAATDSTREQDPIGSSATPLAEVAADLEYVKTPVERLGRKMKLEYIGMTSVYLIIGLLIFGTAPTWHDFLFGVTGAFLLFLGIKKKTRDHLSGSLLLFAATILARGAVLDAGWSLSFLAFASCICAMEGYLEKRQEQSLALPGIFLPWSFLDLSWIPALGFVAAYLLYPWTERPGLRRRLVWIVGLSAILAAGGTALGFGTAPAFEVLGTGRLPLDTTQQLLFLGMGVPTLLCLIAYWKRLIPTHRLNTIVFAAMAPFDERLLAMFGMVAAVTLSATAFRHSIDMASLRPFFKHTEWFYFLLVSAIALWAIFSS